MYTPYKAVRSSELVILYPQKLSQYLGRSNFWGKSSLNNLS